MNISKEYFRAGLFIAKTIIWIFAENVTFTVSFKTSSTKLFTAFVIWVGCKETFAQTTKPIFLANFCFVMLKTFLILENFLAIVTCDKNIMLILFTKWIWWPRDIFVFIFQKAHAKKTLFKDTFVNGKPAVREMFFTKVTGFSFFAIIQQTQIKQIINVCNILSEMFFKTGNLRGTTPWYLLKNLFRNNQKW